MTRAPAWKRALFWPAALLLLIPFGLACLAFPVVRLVVLDHGPHLIDDTRAAFGAGTTEGVPRATSVRCSRNEYGSTRGRGRMHSVEYDCEFALERTDLPPPRAPLDYTGMSPEEQQAAYAADMERFYAEVREATAPRDPLDPPASVQRLLPRTAEGRPLPQLRLLGEAGEPPRYGLVWPDGGLAGRWWQWTWETLFFWAFGAACLFAVRVGWRKFR